MAKLQHTTNILPGIPGQNRNFADIFFGQFQKLFMDAQHTQQSNLISKKLGKSLGTRVSPNKIAEDILVWPRSITKLRPKLTQEG